MENYFIALEKIQCEVEKKNWLNYISWSDGWAELKKVYPDATYRKIKNWDTYLFRSWTGGSVECEVTVWEITHCADLAITDFKNQEIKYESIKSTDIQNTLQRAFAKAIAMHWIGLYVYRWEDFPEDEAKQVEDDWVTVQDYIDSMKLAKTPDELKELFMKWQKKCKTDAEIENFTKIKDEKKKEFN